jgi:hypothetical protein
MQDVVNCLKKGYPLLVHRTSHSSLASIQANGLRPTPQPHGSGSAERNILCLGHPAWQTIECTGSPPCAELAVEAVALTTLGADGSYDYAGRSFEKAFRTMPPAEAFVHSAKQCGSMVTLTSIPPALLSVRMEGSPALPDSTWRRLTDLSTFEKVAEVHPRGGPWDPAKHAFIYE